MFFFRFGRVRFYSFLRNEIPATAVVHSLSESRWGGFAPGRPVIHCYAALTHGRDLLTTVHGTSKAILCPRMLCSVAFGTAATNMAILSEVMNLYRPASIHSFFLKPKTSIYS